MFGAVVGCTEREEASLIRQEYQNLFFLIPGYGAQGGGAKDAALLLQNGNGGVVNASRSIITAWQKHDAQNADNGFAAEKAREAAIKMRDEIREVI
jgi:orotidine-5'-phosphate decarboxylase